MPNRLIHARSPYLQQHANNPVDWMEWGEAAFARAREENKPIFLSIGYSTCHWCHVMAHESFENEAIAELLNRDFISIKVDREERPDVDRVYMTYVQALTGHGGWPLSAWLTPELKPFFGGTYYPPEDRAGRPGLATVLRSIAEGWATKREQLVAESVRVISALTDYLRENSGGAPVGEGAAGDLAEAAEEVFEKCFQYYYESFDEQRGGFGGAPKFPRASNIDFLLRSAVLQGPRSEAGQEAMTMALTTLRRMSEGGLHDHVGGGFHRYSVDEAWFVPHFEKMLYDQAQIAGNLIEAHRLSGDERYAWVAAGVFDYVQRDLTHPQGGFYAAEDADSERADQPDAPAKRKTEGAFYLWPAAELERILGEDFAWFADHFGVQPEGNVPEALDPHAEMRGLNLLKQQRPLVETAKLHRQDVVALADRLAFVLERLRAVRALRPRPHRDDKIIASWNGLMISALANGSRSAATPLARSREFLREAAVRAAEFLQREMYDEATGTLFRTWREGRGANPGYAEDYAAVIAGLLDLYEATFDVRWLQWATRLQQQMDTLFWDAEQGGYFQSPADDPSIVLRVKDDHDGAEPSANSLAAANLHRLALLLQDNAYAARGAAVIWAFRSAWTRTPQALPAMLCAMEWALEAPRQIVLAGDPNSSRFAALRSRIDAQAGRRAVVIGLHGSPDESWLRERAPALAALPASGADAVVYLCEHFTCRSPITDPNELQQVLQDG